MQIHACMLALDTGRPVKMVYDREESFFGHVHRHPARMRYEHGATRDGELVFVRARLVFDGGAYASSSNAVCHNAASPAGPTTCPNADIEGHRVYTNNPPCGAMRGFGAVQVCFAHEAQMDRLAAELGMDPWSCGSNAIDAGLRFPFGQVVDARRRCARSWSASRTCRCRRKKVEHGRDLRGCPAASPTSRTARGEARRRLRGRLQEHRLLGRLRRLLDGARQPFGREGEPPLRSTRRPRKSGRVVMVQAQIVRTELGVETWPCCPRTPVGGRLHLGLAPDLRDRRRCQGAPARGPARRRWLPREASVGGDGRVARGAPRRRGDRGDRRVSPHSDRAARRDGQGNVHLQFAFAAHRAVVEVDAELGLVRVVEVATAQDVGKAMNPQALEGQIEGGIAQGLGLALLEEIQIKEGKIQNASFTDYLIPTILDMPAVRWIPRARPPGRSLRP